MGISIGLTRLFAYLLEAGVVKPAARTPAKVLVTVMERARLADYFAVATALRRAGIPTEIYLEDKRIKAQVKYADKKGIPLALIAGEDEFASGVWQVKDMRNGTQTAVPQNDLNASIKILLGI